MKNKLLWLGIGLVLLSLNSSSEEIKKLEQENQKKKEDLKKDIDKMEKEESKETLWNVISSTFRDDSK